MSRRVRVQLLDAHGSVVWAGVLEDTGPLASVGFSAALPVCGLRMVNDVTSVTPAERSLHDRVRALMDETLNDATTAMQELLDGVYDVGSWVAARKRAAAALALANRIGDALYAEDE